MPRRGRGRGHAGIIELGGGVGKVGDAAEEGETCRDAEVSGPAESGDGELGPRSDEGGGVGGAAAPATGSLGGVGEVRRRCAEEVAGAGTQWGAVSSW